MSIATPNMVLVSTSYLVPDATSTIDAGRQQLLFGEPNQGTPARRVRKTQPRHRRHSSTSRAAAASIEPIMAGRLAAILQCIRAAGTNGRTRNEIEIALGVKIQSVCPAVVQLLDAGLIRETDQTRPTTSGRAAKVLVAVDWRST